MESDTEKTSRILTEAMNERRNRMYPIRMSVCRNEVSSEEKRLKAHAERIRRTKAKKKAKY